MTYPVNHLFIYQRTNTNDLIQKYLIWRLSQDSLSLQNVYLYHIQCTCTMPCFNFSILNTLRPRPNGHHFPDDIFQCIFLNENVWILIKISLTFVPKGPIKNMPALVQIMAWRRPGDKPLSEPMMVNLQTHICVNQPQRVNTLRPRQYNCCYPPMHFLKWKLLLFLFQLHWNLFLYGPINNMQALVQKMVWHITGDKPLSEPMMT